MGESPSLHSICLTIAWATSYATKELNEKHPRWEDYFAYSEWFRHRICSHLSLPLGTEWGEIYRRVGVLDDEEYENQEECQKAYKFGESQSLRDKIAHRMLKEFRGIKYQIVGRV